MLNYIRTFAVGLLLASFNMAVKASPIFAPEPVPNALELIYPTGPVTQGSTASFGVVPPIYQGVWANVSLAIIYPNYTYAGHVWSSSLPNNTDATSPQLCGSIVTTAELTFPLTVPGTYGLVWTETLYFPASVNLTDVSVTCSGGITSTEVSTIQKTFDVVASSNSVAQPTVAPNTIVASFSAQPTGTVYFNTLNDGSHSSDAVQSSTASAATPSTSHKPNTSTRGASTHSAPMVLAVAVGGLLTLMV